MLWPTLNGSTIVLLNTKKQIKMGGKVWYVLHVLVFSTGFSHQKEEQPF